MYTCRTSMQAVRAALSQFSATRYPSLLGRQRQYGMRSLPNTSTQGQQWESNPRYFELSPVPYPLGHMLPYFAVMTGFL